MERSRPEQVGWLTEFSAAAFERAARSVVPELAGLPMSIERGPSFDKPMWASGRAVIDGRVFAKLAFSEPTAARIWREAQVLDLLGRRLGLPVPKVVAAHPRPAFLATERVVGGEPLSYSSVAGLAQTEIGVVASELAHFLSTLHATSTLDLALEEIDDLPRLPDPGLHGSTNELRARFAQMVDARQGALVLEWCDWIDEQLSAPGEAVLVHGDFHPCNQLWQLNEPRLLAVLDLESSGLAEPEFDFMVLPVFGPGVELLLSTIDRYETMSGRRLSVPRIMALHLRNYLGDALWRTEAGIGLPEPGGTPFEYVEQAAGRLAELELI